jgi:aminopeptidase N
MHLLEGQFKGTRVEMYYSRLPEQKLQSRLNNLIESLNRLTQFYGAPAVKGMLRFAYSPRSGWGYSRIPLFVVAEEYALYEMSQEFGEARDFHGNCHELAHFWWLLADTSTPDDWINEGLAEFSAFRLSQERFGQDFADKLIGEYRQHASESQTSAAIAETESSSPDRYVNRYEKTTLMFVEAQRRFGPEQLDDFLKSLHSRYAGAHRLTTALFLQEVESRMGEEAREFFQEAVYRKHSPQ